MQIEQSLHYAAPHPLGYAQTMHIAYASLDQPILLESLLVQDEHRQRQLMIRRSLDDGLTWSTIESFQEDHACGKRLYRHYPPIVVCPSRPGSPLMRIINVCEHRQDVPMWDSKLHPLWRTLRPYLQFSRDGGCSWSAMEPLHLDMPGCDSNRWMPGVYAGRNGCVICSSPAITTPDGATLLTCYAARLQDNGDIIDPNADPDHSNPDGAVERMAACLRLEWSADHSRPRWTTSDWIRLDQAHSCDGVCEPAIDYLPDGRLFMVLRARVYPHTRQALPAAHYYVTSRDNGRTWSQPQPLIYDDNSWAYSPACLAHVVRCPHSHELYILTNLADGPCYNCDPRDKLYLAQIDPTSCHIRKDSIQLIAAQDTAIQPPGSVRYSNFQWYMQRSTKQLALMLTPSGPSQPGDIPSLVSHAYRYAITLPSTACIQKTSL